MSLEYQARVVTMSGPTLWQQLGQMCGAVGDQLVGSARMQMELASTTAHAQQSLLGTLRDSALSHTETATSHLMQQQVSAAHSAIAERRSLLPETSLDMSFLDSLSHTTQQSHSAAAVTAASVAFQSPSLLDTAASAEGTSGAFAANAEMSAARTGVGSSLSQATLAQAEAMAWRERLSSALAGEPRLLGVLDRETSRLEQAAVTGDSAGVAAAAAFIVDTIRDEGRALAAHDRYLLQSHNQLSSLELNLARLAVDPAIAGSTAMAQEVGQVRGKAQDIAQQLLQESRVQSEAGASEALDATGKAMLKAALRQLQQNVHALQEKAEQLQQKRQECAQNALAIVAQAGAIAHAIDAVPGLLVLARRHAEEPLQRGGQALSQARSAYIEGRFQEALDSAHVALIAYQATRDAATTAYQKVEQEYVAEELARALREMGYRSVRRQERGGDIILSGHNGPRAFAVRVEEGGTVHMDTEGFDGLTCQQAKNELLSRLTPQLDLEESHVSHHPPADPPERLAQVPGSVSEERAVARVLDEGRATPPSNGARSSQQARSAEAVGRRRQREAEDEGSYRAPSQRQRR